MEKQLKKYNIILSEDIVYTKANTTLEEAKAKYPETVVTLPSGTILWSQDEPLNIDQIVKAKKDGITYQFGFGPANFKIPFNKLKFIKAEFLEV